MLFHARAPNDNNSNDNLSTAWILKNAISPSVMGFIIKNLLLLNLIQFSKKIPVMLKMNDIARKEW